MLRDLQGRELSEATHLVGETWRNLITKHYEYGRWDLEQLAFICEMLGFVLFRAGCDCW
jgi:hypothetical protein